MKNPHDFHTFVIDMPSSDLTFGDLLRRLRRNALLTQEELAEKASLSTREVSDLERGLKHTPRRDTVLLLADALALTGDDRRQFLAAARAEKPDDRVLSSPPESPRSGLPAPATPFIGRETDVAALCVLLQNPPVRLVTLVGPGGTGKTRLALETARRLLPAYRDGVFFVSLAPIADPALVLSTIAAAVGAREIGGHALSSVLAERLRSLRMLLLLDNLEHLLPSAAAAIAGLLAATEALTVLATSREVLHLSAEHVVEVPPMAVPGPQSRVDPDQLLQIDAVRLFVERAAAAGGGFALTPDNAADVAGICRDLDGLPLAIELAAARIRLFPPDSLHAHLSHRLPLLTGGARDLPRRHQTLRGTIDWSFELLTPRERTLFNELSVFAGAWTLAAAEAVCGGNGEILDDLASLVDKSLVQRSRAGAPRFFFLETIREYAAERLDADRDAETLRRRHAEYFCTLAEEARPHLRGEDQVRWLDLLEQEHNNLRAALAWSLDRGEGTIALRIAGSLGWFWYTHCHYAEGTHWLHQALAARDSADPALRTTALLGLGYLAESRGDRIRARAAFEDALALSRAAGDHEGESTGLNNLAILAMFDHNYGEAQRLYEASLEISRRLQDRHGIGMTLHNLAVLAWDQADHDRARALFEESLPHFLDIGDLHSRATALLNLGQLAQLRGADREATGHLLEALAVFEDAGDVVSACKCLDTLAQLIAVASPDRAARLLGAAEALRNSVGAIPAEEERASHDRTENRVREELDDGAWRLGVNEGHSMTLAEAASFALQAARA